MKPCVIDGCDKPRSKRGVTCSPEHAHLFRYGKSEVVDKERVVVPEQLTVHEEHALRKENRKLRRSLADVVETQEKERQLLSLIDGLRNVDLNPPEWIYSPKSGDKQGTPTAHMSDMHYDEWVDPKQIEYLNGYDREIAVGRTRRFFENTIDLAKGYLKGINYPGIILNLGGDTFSGDIHEELEKTNVATIQEGILFWIDPMVAGIRMLADEFGAVHIPCVVGNHPRSTRKPSHKMRVPNNFDWLFYCLLAKFLQDDKRITWQISDSADLDYRVYNTNFRLSHGDQFKGGSGISGALSPMMIGDARKRKRSVQQKRPYDYLVLGHWHQYFGFRGILANGSLKGYDEYAYHGNFDYEPPRQSFWITDPRHGVTIAAPIHVQGKNEPWMKNRNARAALFS